MNESHKNDCWWEKKNESMLKSLFPLHTAVRDGDMETALSLLKSGRFNLYEEDGFYGWTPVHWAANFGKLDILRKFISMLVDCSPVVWTCCKRVTPAHLASLAGHPHCLQWLLQAGTDPSLQDYLGETPLHKAARAGSMECVTLLIAHGAAVGLRNQSGHTASQVAALGGFQECAIHLEKCQQFQEQSMAANIITSYNCNNNNSAESDVDSRQKIPQEEVSTYHCKPMDHVSREDDMICDMDINTEEGIKPQETSVSNGFHSILHNGVVGVKRGRDDPDEDFFKRRKFDDVSGHLDLATPENNNILSSYNAILAISANPCNASDLPGPTKDGISTSSEEDTVKGCFTYMQPTSSIFEHKSTIIMQQGYDKLLLQSLEPF